MKFIFLGSPKFAEIILKKILAAGRRPEAVICNPDRKIGRKQISTPPPTKELALKEGLAILQPEEIDDKLMAEAASFGAEFAIIAAYAKIVPMEFLKIFPRGVIGIHPSLLPKYRGATPIQSAILDGADESGVSLYMVDEKMDHGPVIEMTRIKIGGLDYKTAEENLARAGGELLAAIWDDFQGGQIKLKEQKHTEATFTRKIKSEDGLVPLPHLRAAIKGEDLKAAEEIYKKILALNPNPGVYIINKGRKRIKLLKAIIEDEKLVLKKIQMEGKRPTERFETGGIFR